MPSEIEVVNFIRESNKIEGILRDPKPEEILEFHRFMALIQPTVADMVQFVSVYQPNAKLRDKHGLDVRVGRHIAPRGGPEIKDALVDILYSAHNLNSYSTHLSYETLHPFTDGNGRSGRMLWAWQVRDLRLGFLHKFYYQTLDARR